jgi:hypothetical protein
VSVNEKYKSWRLLFVARYSSFNQVYLNTFTDQFYPSNISSWTFRIKNISVLRLVLLSIRDIFALSLAMSQMKDIQPVILCVQRHKSLCWLNCTAHVACLHVWITFLHKYKLCHLHTCVPHKVQQKSRCVQVSILATESIMPFCRLNIFLRCTLCAWFSLAHSLICFLYWDQISSIAAGSFSLNFFVCVLITWIVHIFRNVIVTAFSII